MVKKIAAVFTAVVLGVLLTGGSAWAAERQNFTLLSVNNDTTVIATGAITVRGVEKVIEEAFNDDGKFTSISSFVFEDGTVFLTAKGQASFTLDRRTCVGRYSGTGIYDITGGSGDFEGATGDGTNTVRGIFVVGRNADGSCSADEQFNFTSAQRRGDIAFEFFSAQLTGDIAFDGAAAA